MTNQASTRVLSVSDLNTTITRDEPRIQDVRLGERLGMSQPLNIRKTIDKNRAELEQYGSIHAAREMIKVGKGARRAVDVHWLNEAQSLLLCMFARTERAAMVRKEVINVYLAVRRSARSAIGHPTQEPGLWGTTIGTDGFHCLAALLDGKLRRFAPHAQAPQASHLVAGSQGV